MNDLTIPEYLRGVESSVTSNIADSAVGSKARINLENKKFTFIDGDDESKPAKEAEVVILGYYPEDKGVFIKQYREKSYNPKNNRGEAPDCASDGVRPYGWVKKPISNSCLTCPYNEFGSAADGGKGKRCKDSKTIFVMKADDVASGTVYMLNAAWSNWTSLAEYAKNVRAKGLPLEALITKLTFDEESSIALLKFEAAGFLAKDDALQAIEIAKAKDFIPKQTVYAAMPAPAAQRAIPAPSEREAPEYTPEQENEILNTVIAGESVLDGWD